MVHYFVTHFSFCHSFLVLLGCTCI
jgi:hypothetical protein